MPRLGIPLQHHLQQHPRLRPRNNSTNSMRRKPPKPIQQKQRHIHLVLRRNKNRKTNTHRRSKNKRLHANTRNSIQNHPLPKRIRTHDNIRLETLRRGRINKGPTHPEKAWHGTDGASTATGKRSRPRCTKPSSEGASPSSGRPSGRRSKQGCSRTGTSSCARLPPRGRLSSANWRR